MSASLRILAYHRYVAGERLALLRRRHAGGRAEAVKAMQAATTRLLTEELAARRRAGRAAARALSEPPAGEPDGLLALIARGPLPPNRETAHV